jgi:hypothetical protein
MPMMRGIGWWPETKHKGTTNRCVTTGVVKCGIGQLIR